MHGWYFYPCDLESNEEKNNNSSTIQEDDIALKVNLSRITPSVSPSREPASKVTLSFMVENAKDFDVDDINLMLELVDL